MRLIGEVNGRSCDAVLKQGMPRRDQAGEIRHRAAADKQTTGRCRKSTDSRKPANNAQLHRRSSRSAEPGTVKNIKSGSERVRHRAHEIVRARNKGEEARMIDMQIVRKNVALQLREQLVWIATCFRRIVFKK